jgi:hypothetical protein
MHLFIHNHPNTSDTFYDLLLFQFTQVSRDVARDSILVWAFLIGWSKSGFTNKYRGRSTFLNISRCQCWQTLLRKAYIYFKLNLINLQHVSKGCWQNAESVWPGTEIISIGYDLRALECCFIYICKLAMCRLFLWVNLPSTFDFTSQPTTRKPKI